MAVAVDETGGGGAAPVVDLRVELLEELVLQCEIVGEGFDRGVGRELGVEVDRVPVVQVRAALELHDQEGDGDDGAAHHAIERGPNGVLCRGPDEAQHDSLGFP